jgi:hypothetical protein
MSPFRSKAQQRWAYSKAGQEALGEKKLEEFEQATNFDRLPEKVAKKKRKKKSYREVLREMKAKQ